MQTINFYPNAYVCIDNSGKQKSCDKSDEKDTNNIQLALEQIIRIGSIQEEMLQTKVKVANLELRKQKKEKLSSIRRKQNADKVFLIIECLIVLTSYMS